MGASLSTVCLLLGLIRPVGRGSVAMAQAQAPALAPAPAQARAVDPNAVFMAQLSRVRATNAWLAEGPGRANFGAGVSVAVVDSGVNIHHPDLISNVAVNFKEIPGNGIDDDKNGHIDDTIGVDLVMKSNVLVDMNGHGTHVAGIIAGNRSGVAPKAKIMPIRFLNLKGRGGIQDIIRGISYAVSRGARVVNLSLAASGPSTLERDEFERIVAHARKLNVLLVAAAGNEASDNDRAPVYPANVAEGNLLSVCSVDEMNRLSSFSNYGKKSVHLCAPGEDILSTNLMLSIAPYRRDSGTSFAAPFVAGAAALVLAANPKLKAYDVGIILRQSVDRFSSLGEACMSGGVLRARNKMTS